MDICEDYAIKHLIPAPVLLTCQKTVLTNQEDKKEGAHPQVFDWTLVLTWWNQEESPKSQPCIQRWKPLFFFFILYAGGDKFTRSALWHSYPGLGTVHHRVNINVMFKSFLSFHTLLRIMPRYLKVEQGWQFKSQAARAPRERVLQFSGNIYTNEES